ncbi:hypothetical protein Bbelb_324380 [Branchiostoma belcheri]|nr:hypothetical protein Bbelb_324380 [Branchiostoma belcheri]
MAVTVNFSSEIPIDVKMEATVEPLSSGTLKREVDPLKNGQIHGQKTAMNVKVKGVVNDVKQQLTKTVAILGNGSMFEEQSLTPLEKELKELRLEVVELKPYRDNAPKLEKDVKDLHEALQQSQSKVQQQQEQIKQLQMELENTQRTSALEKEALETRSGEEIRLLQEKLMSSERNLQQEKEQIKQLQVEKANTQRTSAELALEKEALETSSGEEIRLLQEQLRSSVARKKAWAYIATLKAGAKRLVVEHRDKMNTALEEHKQLAERVKEQEILLRRLHPLLPGVDDLVDCQRHLAELTGDDIQLTAHMRECQSCQRVVTHYLFHIKTCHKINCERCAYVRQLYCGHVFTCEREGCDITGCEETKQAIRDSQLSPEELQNNKQFRDKISVHLRRITSPSCGTAECGGIFRAFQQRGYWAVAVGPVNLHRHQINNRLLQRSG